jgi:YegS/Rv2252/BmrU family lipid kinase
MENIRFIVNPVSGTFRRGDIDTLLKYHLNHQKFNHDIQFTKAPLHATELAQEAVEEGLDIVVAVGGDGSVNEVAAGLIGSKTTLGVLPGGSGNGFAMHMGIGRRLKKGLRVLNDGQRHLIDTVRLNGTPFVNLSGVGFDASVAYLFKKSKRRGFFNYFRITMNQAYKFPFQNYEISIDGQPFMRRECLLVEVANSPSFGYYFQAAPQAKVNDGLLDLVIVNKKPKHQYFAASPRMISGSIHKMHFVECFSCKTVSIRIPKDSYVHMDGEGFLESKILRYEIVPDSLYVIAP